MGEIQETIRVAVLEPDTHEIKDMRIPNTVKGIQSIVGGYFEAVSHPELGEIIILCDEDGRSKNLRPNIWYDDYYILGTVIFAVSDGLGEFIDMTDEHFEKVNSFLWD